jgi:hypothetical protein
MKIETKIQMKVGQKTLELTPQEARELRDALNAIVGHIEYRPYYWTYPVWGSNIGTAQCVGIGTTTTTTVSASNIGAASTYTINCSGSIIDS